MLQQTQVARGDPLLRALPGALSRRRARSPRRREDEVLRLWSGLGYYARGRNLHAAAQDHRRTRRRFRDTAETIAELPGVGRSTAAAIAAFAFGERAAILDGNVKRVLARHFGIAGFPGDKKVEAKLWALAESLLPQNEHRDLHPGADGPRRDASARGASRAATPARSRHLRRAQEGPDRTSFPRRGRGKPCRSQEHDLAGAAPRGQVLLERRPSPGIWGGLWSFPEATGSNVAKSCRDWVMTSARCGIWMPSSTASRTSA